MESNPYRFHIPGTLWGYVAERANLQSSDPEEAAVDRLALALSRAERKKLGRGYTYIIEADLECLNLLWVYAGSCYDQAISGDGPTRETKAALNVCRRIEKLRKEASDALGP